MVVRFRSDSLRVGRDLHARRSEVLRTVVVPHAPSALREDAVQVRALVPCGTRHMAWDMMRANKQTDGLFRCKMQCTLAVLVGCSATSDQSQNQSQPDDR